MKFANAEHTMIDAGDGRFVSIASGNEYDLLIASGASIEPYATPPIAASDVKAEARARIVEKYPSWKQLNLIREGGEQLTEMSAFIDAIRVASYNLETSLPDDFRDDGHWPA